MPENRDQRIGLNGSVKNGIGLTRVHNRNPAQGQAHTNTIEEPGYGWAGVGRRRKIGGFRVRVNPNLTPQGILGLALGDEATQDYSVLSAADFLLEASPSSPPLLMRALQLLYLWVLVACPLLWYSLSLLLWTVPLQVHMAYMHIYIFVYIYIYI